MTTERIAIENEPAKPPLDNPAVAHYTANTGPWLGVVARAVFRELGRYVDPAIGTCFPSQGTIARVLDLSRQSVAKQCLTLEAAGEITIDQKEGASGKQNVYTFVGGLRRSWAPTEKPDIGDLPLAIYYLRESTQQKTEIEGLRRIIARLSPTGEIPNDQPEPTLPIETPNVASGPNMKEEEEIHPDSDLIKSSSSSTGPDSNVNEKLTSDIQTWVGDSWHRISAAAKKGGWEIPAKAIRYYIDNPDKFELDKFSLELLLEGEQKAGAERSPTEQRGDLLPGLPVDDPILAVGSGAIDPEASAVWNEVLDDLREQVPNPTFKTWLEPTVGVGYHNDNMVVATPSRIIGEWLERRMHGALVRTLEKKAGRELGIWFLVRPDAGTDPGLSEERI